MSDKRCIADRTVEREQIFRNDSTPLFHLVSRRIFIFQPSLPEFALSHSNSNFQPKTLKKKKEFLGKLYILLPEVYSYKKGHKEVIS